MRISLVQISLLTAIFQNFPKIFGLCVFIPTWLMQFWSYFCHLRFYLPFILLLRSLGKNMPNAIFG